MAKKKKLSDTKLGDEREEQWRDKRISEGWLSFKRNRMKFKPIDLWKCFDVLSMNGHIIELAQVKGEDSRGEQKQIRDWVEENRDKIPSNVRCIVVYDKRNDPAWHSKWREVVIKEAEGYEETW